MPIDLGYTIQGRGGQALYWLDNAGGVPWGALMKYNFALLPKAKDAWASTGSGSFLLSTPFAVGSGQKLTVKAMLASAHAEPSFDVGFALLVRGAQVEEVLFVSRPDNVDWRGDTGPTITNLFAKPSADVMVTSVEIGAAGLVLGGVNYGLAANAESGLASADITAVCAPKAGTYQLLFGMFAIDGAVEPERPAAMVVEYVDVGRKSANRQ
jgi:hypothetical protein